MYATACGCRWVALVCFVCFVCLFGWLVGWLVDCLFFVCMCGVDKLLVLVVDIGVSVLFSYSINMCFSLLEFPVVALCCGAYVQRILWTCAWVHWLALVGV